jgi:hypothetical protein
MKTTTAINTTSPCHVGPRSSTPNKAAAAAATEKLETTTKGKKSRRQLCDSSTPGCLERNAGFTKEQQRGAKAMRKVWWWWCGKTGLPAQHQIWNCQRWCGYQTHFRRHLLLLCAADACNVIIIINNNNNI